MKVLIVSKTHVWGSACVGGLSETGQSVRLKDSSGQFPSAPTYEIGQLWDLDFVPHPDSLPHVEDVWVRGGKRVDHEPQLRAHLLGRITPQQGSIAVLFEGMLSQTANGSCYISTRTGVPDYSTGFWLPDANLRFEAPYYFYGPYRMKYVGFADPIPLIPAGTLVRVSLARWWAPSDADVEQRCYLQLSGWYF